MQQPDDVPRGTLGTVRNATLLLDLLSQGPPYQQLTDLAERSSLSLPTVHRLLRSLAAAGLVEQDPISLRYGLGGELVRLAERYLARLPVFRAISPYLVELRNATKATLLAAVLVRGWTVYIDRVDGDDPGGIFREPARMRPAFETAAGRLLSARSLDAAWEDALASATNGDHFTVSDRRRWAKAPYLVIVEEPHDLAEIAVPVISADGTALASLVAVGSADTYSEEVLVEQVAPRLTRAAAAVARAVSHG
ncbi:MAG: helix-turn-helix domain-containing protein [Actinobacteria bacterium]|nr:helix-turn-helix domain-containing protein [Actinomycetota bacterium]